MNLDEIKSKVLGLTEDAAAAIIKSLGFKSRLASKDGEDLGMTMDYVDDRVNLYLKDGLVEKVVSG